MLLSLREVKLMLLSLCTLTFIKLLLCSCWLRYLASSLFIIDVEFEFGYIFYSSYLSETISVYETYYYDY